MPNLTTPSLPSIASDLLLSVNGGCHGGGKQCSCPAPSSTLMMNNFLLAGLGTQTPQPDPNALAASSAPAGDVVKISVNTGTGTPTTATA